jgi:hypothetical protein
VVAALDTFLLANLPHHWGSSWDLDVHMKAADWFTLGIAVGTLVSAGVLAATALFARGALKDAKRDRHIHVLSDFGRRWDDARIVEARDKQRSYTDIQLADAVEKWAKGGEAGDIPLLLRVPNFFEDLALMVELGRLEVSFVARSFKTMAQREWAYWELAVTKLRERDKDAYVEFQQLVRDLGDDPERS